MLVMRSIALIILMLGGCQKGLQIHLFNNRAILRGSPFDYAPVSQEENEK